MSCLIFVILNSQMRYTRDKHDLVIGIHSHMLTKISKHLDLNDAIETQQLCLLQ